LRDVGVEVWVSDSAAFYYLEHLPRTLVDLVELLLKQRLGGIGFVYIGSIGRLRRNNLFRDLLTQAFRVSRLREECGLK
jgi:hypothetical protein